MTEQEQKTQFLIGVFEDIIERLKDGRYVAGESSAEMRPDAICYHLEVKDGKRE